MDFKKQHKIIICAIWVLFVMLLAIPFVKAQDVESEDNTPSTEEVKCSEQLTDEQFILCIEEGLVSGVGGVVEVVENLDAE